VLLSQKLAIIRTNAHSVDRNTVTGLSYLLRYLRDGKGAGSERGGNYALETSRITPNTIKGNREKEI
jgi:hypothetical protein